MFFRYGKTKETFGWPDETEDAVASSTSAVVPSSSGAATDGEQTSTNPTPVTKLER